ncbi:1f57906d-c9c8-4f46-8503-38a1268884cc [Sclerotinia trifoliorum]|uniref:1f57906d-c9c8-4f46-8503-38a1268884cc n=1 Tax=Sclerotinia trifoliorum TaxID=28548 RepID=A0A8H2ZMC7_9HELO|nr:1f57906d-c9c8-4f46-8503-38a1268884cc [Sclerotinia trifoliorum]
MNVDMVPLHHSMAISLHPKIQEPFQFQIIANPPNESSFPFFAPASLPYRYKRARPLSDVDGKGNSVEEGRKKRRLRLHLITSRLSRPFSVPATNINIAYRGGCAKNFVLGGKRKFGEHGGKKEFGIGSGKNMLRKIAILNRVRLQMQMQMQMQLHGAEEVLCVCRWSRSGSESKRKEERLGLDVGIHLKEIVKVTEKQNKRWNEFVLPPSPLGRSNYDVLDSEDDMFMDELEDGCEKEIYSDFNVMRPTGEGDDYEYMDTLDGLSPEDMQEQPPSPPEGEKVMEIFKEQRLHDSYFLCLESS